MNRIFAITTASDRVSVAGDGRGEITFTVTNSSTRPLRGQLRVRPLGSTQGEWLNIVGETERAFSPNATQQVVVNALFEDPDGDSIDLYVHWVAKDEVLPDTSPVLQLLSLGLKKNDVITGAAFADDGEYRSEAFTFEIPVANAPPAFRTKIDSVKSSTDSVYYQLPVYDPDGDPLHFEILDAPRGINIDTEQGIIYGSADTGEAFEVSVRATDTEGAYLDARFTLTAK